MDDFKQWLARVFLNCASRLLQTKRAYNGARGWRFDNDWTQPVSESDAAEDRQRNERTVPTK